MILGLDLGTKAGWALRVGDGWCVGEWNFTPKPATKKRPPEPEGVRFTKLFDELGALLDTWPEVNVVCIEQPFSKSRRASEVLSGFIAIAEVVLERRGIEYVFVPASTLKAFGRRQGVPDTKEEGALKEAMRVAAQDVLALGDVSDNVADAYWIVRWCEEATKP